MRGSLMVRAAVLCLLLAACATGQPSCHDNPRNMRCMTGAELTAALEAK